MIQASQRSDGKDVRSLEAIPERTATHEAGHGVVAEILGFRVEKIVLQTFQDGFTELDEVVLPRNPTQAAAAHRGRATVALAGRHAVRLLLGEDAAAEEEAQSLTHAQEDSAQANRFARCAAELTGEDPALVRSGSDERAVSLLSQPAVRLAVQRVATTVTTAGRAGVEGDTIRPILSKEVQVAG